VASGQYGGSRQGIAQGLALSDASRQSLDTTSKMYSDMYGQNLDAMQKAVMMNEAVTKGGTLPDQLLATVGSDRRSMQQALLDDALARWSGNSPCRRRSWRSMRARSRGATVGRGPVHRLEKSLGCAT